MDKKICQICGKEMLRRTKHDFADRDWNKKTTCSIKCRSKWVAKIRRKKWKPKKCKNCGKDIVKRISKQIFCDDKCIREYRRGKNIGRQWKGGIKKHGEYIQILVGKEHLFSDFHGYIMEHRLIFERYAIKNNLTQYLIKDIKMGRLYLNPQVKIHHKNHNKSDNRISNLVPMLSQKEHFHYNYCPHCPHCNKSDELLGTPNKDNQQPS